MQVKDFILSRFEELQAPVKSELNAATSIEDAVYAKIMSKKFRKLKPGDECVRITKQAIKIAVREGKPIRIFQMFGGNKLWRFEEAPEIDWAKVFSFVYFMNWCKLITSVYPPGVIYEYFSQDVSVERLNNVPRSQTDRYSNSFRGMLEFMKPYIPSGIEVRYTRHLELFADPADYDREMEIARNKILKQNNGKLPVLTKEMIAATELNVKLKPGQSRDPNWREEVELEHQAIFISDTLRKYCDSPDIIWTCPTYYPDSIVTGSTKRSYAKFWAAVGVLQKDQDSFAELVLTPKQLKNASFNWEDIEIEGLQGKNFSKIRIIH